MLFSRVLLVAPCCLIALACSSGTTSNQGDAEVALETLEETVAPQLALHAVQPSQGSGWGGETVSLHGEGFVEGMTVRFGSVAGSAVVFLTDQVLEVQTPKLGAGLWDVEVEKPDGETVVLQGGFQTTQLGLKFVEAPSFSFPSWPASGSTCGAAADFDGDGHLDLVVCADGAFKFLAGDGNGNFVDATWPELPEDPSEPPPLEPDVQTGDVGVVDIVNWPESPDIAPMDIPEPDVTSEPPEVPDSRFPPGPFDCRFVVAADMDLDDTMDLFVSTGPQQRHLLLLNSGTGYFFDDPQLLPEDYVDDGGGAAVGDVDGDGFPDVVVANGNASEAQKGQLRVWLFRITGGFTALPESGLPAAAEVGSAVALADVDGDGDLDIVTGALEAADGVTLRLFINDDSTFSPAPPGALPEVTTPISHITGADLDGDDAPELFLLSPDGQDLLLANDGQGYFFDFTTSGLPVDKAVGAHAAAGDVNLDGYLDLVIANSGGQNRLYLNDGTGRFADHTPLFPIYYDDSTWTLVPDLDADGDLDVVFLNGAGDPNRLYLSVPPEVTQ